MSNFSLEERLEKVGWLDKLTPYSQFFVKAEHLKEVSKKQLSIVIISWREHPDTLSCLQKLGEQDNHEVIFVNNGASDSVFKSLFPHIHVYVKLNKNIGDCKARNIGAIFADTPILCFLDDDAFPEKDFVKAHLRQYETYDIIGLRGLCKPKKKDNKYNELGRHYNLGKAPYPRFSDLEGNSSYLADPFYKVGGWDDEIFFGHSGIVLSKRLLEVADFRKQMYSPEPIIYHDYVPNKARLKEKASKHKQALELIEKKYGTLNSIRNVWEVALRKEEELLKKGKK